MDMLFYVDEFDKTRRQYAVIADLCRCAFLAYAPCVPIFFFHAIEIRMRFHGKRNKLRSLGNFRNEIMDESCMKLSAFVEPGKSALPSMLIILV